MTIVVQQALNKQTYEIKSEEFKMMIGGQISSSEEAKEMESIVKLSVVGRRAGVLGLRAKKGYKA